VPIPTSPGKFTILREYLTTERMLRGKTDQYFLNLPIVSDSTKAVTMTMLSFVWWYGSGVMPDCAALSIFRMISHAMKHGITGPAALSFAIYGILVSHVFGRAERAYRFGQLSLALIEKCEAKSWLPRTQFVVYGVLNVWTRPLRDSLDPLTSAHLAAKQAGDSQGSSICAASHAINALSCGVSLVDLEEILRARCEWMNASGQIMGLVYLVPIWTCVNELMGFTRGTLRLSGFVVDSTSACAHAQKEDNRQALSLFYVHRTMVETFLGEYDRALALAKKSREFSLYADNRQSFYQGLASFAIARSSTGRSKRRLVA
jgi:predicted ATPase